MAEEEVIEEVEGGEAPAPSGGGKMKIIIIAVVVLVLVGGAAAYFLVLGGGEGGGSEKSAEQVAEEEAAQEKDFSLGVTRELEPFIVNLSGDMNRYLKVVIVLQLSTQGVSEELGKRGPQIKDSVITVLSSKTPDEILTVQGKYDLKMELIKRVNAIVSKGVVRDLFFTEFVVQ